MRRKKESPSRMTFSFADIKRRLNSSTDKRTLSANLRSLSPVQSFDSFSCIFEILPEEILYEILMYLNLGDMVSFGSTCKLLNRLTMDDYLWADLYQRNWTANNLHVLEEKPPQSSWRSHYISAYTKLFSSNKEYRIVIVGPDGVDKSSLAVKFVQGASISKYDPSIEDSYRKRIMVDGHVGVLEIMDTAGQEEYFALRDHYIKTAEGIVLLFSVSSRSSFEMMPKFRNSVLRILDNWKEFVPMILVGNNCHVSENERQVSSTEAEEVANKFSIPYLEVSSKTSENINHIFVELVRLIHRWRDISRPPVLKEKRNLFKRRK